MTQMTIEERAAAETYRADLLAEFHVAADAVTAARSAGDREATAEARGAVRRVYSEVKEVEFVLDTGILPL